LYYTPERIHNDFFFLKKTSLITIELVSAPTVIKNEHKKKNFSWKTRLKMDLVYTVDSIERTRFAVSVDGKILLKDKGGIFLLDQTNARNNKFLAGDHDQFNPRLTFSFSPDGKMFATVDTEANFELWSTNTLKCLYFTKTSYDAMCIVWNKDGDVLFPKDNEFVQVDTATYKTVRTFVREIGPYTRIALSPDEKYAVISGWTQLSFYSLENNDWRVVPFHTYKKEGHKLAEENAPKFINNRQIIITRANTCASVIDVPTKQTIRTFSFEPPENPNHIEFYATDVSNDGSCFMTVRHLRSMKMCQIYDITSGKLLFSHVLDEELVHNSAYRWCAKFSPDDTMIYLTHKNKLYKMKTPDIVRMEMQQAIEDRKQTI